MIIPDIYMKTVAVEVEKHKLLRPWQKKKVIEQHRELTKPFIFKGEEVPIGYRWNGANSPRWAWCVISPWKHPKASCWHDFKCDQAQQSMARARNAPTQYLKIIFENEAMAMRKQADKDFGLMVGNSDGKIIGGMGKAGVRLGSLIGKGW